MQNSATFDESKIADNIQKLLEPKETLEPSILAWLSEILKLGQIPSFLQLVEDPVFLSKFSELTKLHNIMPNHAYFSSRTIVTFVDLLSKIWLSQKKIKIFGFFDRHFRKQLSPTFGFEADFEGLLFSHSEAIIYTIIIVSVMSICLVNDENEEDDMIIFECLESLEPKVQVFLKNEFKLILELFDSVCSGEEENLSQSSPYSTERTMRTNTQIELNYVRRIEELQTKNDELAARAKELKASGKALRSELEAKEKLIEEQTRKISQLTFAREDLLEKLKAKNLEFLNAELKEKDEKIGNLAEQLSQAEQRHSARVRELEDEKENLHKKIHRLENYKKEFDTLKVEHSELKKMVSEEPQRTSRLELPPSQQELESAQAKPRPSDRLADKERCLNLEILVGNLNKELNLLRMQKMDLESKMVEFEAGGELNASEVFLQDFQQIVKELSLQKYDGRIKEVFKSFSTVDMQNELIDNAPVSPGQQGGGFARELQNPYLTQRILDVLNDLKRECLSRIKLLCRELEEYKSQAHNALKDVEVLKDSLEELEERANANDNEIVINLLIQNNELAKIFRQVRDTHKESAEIPQDLLKVIMKKEGEISRLKRSRKRMQKEVIEAELKMNEAIRLLYGVMYHYFDSGISS